MNERAANQEIYGSLGKPRTTMVSLWRWHYLALENSWTNSEITRTICSISLS